MEPTIATTTDNDRKCTICQGAGYNEYEGVRHSCISCKGKGTFPPFSVEKVLNRVLTTRKNKTFRASFDTKYVFSDLDEARAYFVWRLTRFHGGADVTMPVTAGMAVTGDPYKQELDYVASILAKRAFGTHIAGAARWAGVLLGVEIPKELGLPASAYSGGPVADGNKPDIELAELK